MESCGQPFSFREREDFLGHIIKVSRFDERDDIEGHAFVGRKIFSGIQDDRSNERHLQSAACRLAIPSRIEGEFVERFDEGVVVVDLSRVVRRGRGHSDGENIRSLGSDVDGGTLVELDDGRTVESSQDMATGLDEERQ